MFRTKDYLTNNERKILVYLLFVIFLGLIVKYLAVQNESEFTGEIGSTDIYEEKIDIRTADESELQRLPRIGEILAKRIVDYRKQTPFLNVNDLMAVKGIGVKTMARMSPYLVIFGDSLVAKVTTEVMTEGKLIDINKAGLAEFISLPGIGAVKAQRIIDRRNDIGKFSSIEDLLEVNGIGEKTLAKMKPLIKCER